MNDSFLGIPLHWLLIILTVIICVMLLAIFFSYSRLRRWQRDYTMRLIQQTHQEHDENTKVQQHLNDLTIRMQTMAEIFGNRQTEVARTLSERMDGISHRLGQNLNESGRQTTDSLRQLHERLAVIDKAQNNITNLSGQVTALQNILSDKHARGMFGQGRMEVIIADNLPEKIYEFQATLSNGTRPDCLIHMPNDTPDLVVDSKFPLEAFQRIIDSNSPEETRSAQQQFRKDITKHINDIASRYFIIGETHDTAFMFVPSESIFAELHENFDDIVQRAYRARVVIVSPSLLMLSIQVIQSILRDQQVREQAHIIQDEVGRLMEDMGRLHERVEKLQRHFGQATQDVDNILISTRKITGRAEKITNLDLGDSASEKIQIPQQN